MTVWNPVPGMTFGFDDDLSEYDYVTFLVGAGYDGILDDHFSEHLKNK